MARTTKWLRRAVVIGAIGALVARLLAPKDRGQGSGPQGATVIGGDTWPPVPQKPDRSD